MHVSSILKIEEVAAFIANMNKDATHHVGYCGDEKEELLQTIIHDFSDIGWEQSFVATYENNNLIGVLGFDVDEVKNVQRFGDRLFFQRIGKKLLYICGRNLSKRCLFILKSFMVFIMWKIIIVPA
ncbi:hypothetical protein BACERE00185_03174 [Bacillus mobilis]|uniref:Uncharacterized protein n=1 Tax=Bacillus mobilis TaxID=2026190 RepID=A0A1Y5ZX33_9BACI|nr:hypothetical protein BACERE00185_03174 [Bacillus mobilis]